MTDLELAIHLANKFHAGQTYGSFVYTYHLGAVAQSVKAAYPGDERLEIIAWLHDILEDTACTEEILRGLFESDIVHAVVAMTMKDGQSRDEYLTRLATNPLALKVKMHDAFCNMTESFNRNDTRRVRKYAETLIKLSN